MKDRPKDSSASKTTEVPAVFLVEYATTAEGREWTTAFFNTFADALDFASRHMDHLKKAVCLEGDWANEKDAGCAIYQRVCHTKGTATQTVHLIS